MIRAKPEIVPFKAGDTVALIHDTADIYTIISVEPNHQSVFGYLLKLEDAQHKVIWDWSTYYIPVGGSQ